ncbi:MAG: hypothetical protein HY965_07115 [Ignavibacteriales bacterium]|nr:hypothetical protein [Ignavibacteriales bacterium]
MQKKNLLFWEKLTESGNRNVYCEIKLADARKTNIEGNSIDVIITSPPYVTSYEYADIHQLTAYWFEYVSDISDFRKSFIGTFYSKNRDLCVTSTIAQNIVEKLYERNRRLSFEMANYFNDMQAVIKEMHRILKDDGAVCIVVGNTVLRKIEIQTAQVFADFLSLEGFIVEKVIKREITNKQIPTIRNGINGRFAKLENSNSTKIYPNEYIIIGRKKNAN